ncbi:MAG: DNA polymerase III subunit delta [Pseudobutyrivibrio sp.]|nr:DNA polymerase III subunit delta [Pseudobutyrivibrio sp.]MCF0185679.1 DNA polymerase III subunit delta [Bacteroidaceae bacterium]
MRRIDEDLKSGNFSNIYLLYGTEDYLKRQYKDKLVSALIPEGDTMNLSRFDQTPVNIPQIIDLAETMPFFAEHRVIIMDDLGYGKKLPEDLGNYLSTIPEATVFIFIESEVDKRSKLFKAAKEAGRDIEFVMPDANMLFKWASSRLAKCGKVFTREAWSEFMERTGESMDNMSSELSKLIDYTGDRKEITKSDVEAICIAHIETKIVFDMISAIAAKDLPKALEIYNDLLCAKEPPMRILSLIVRQFRQMRLIKDLLAHGENYGNIARKAGMADFVVKKVAALSDNFTKKEIDSLLADAADYELMAKTGRLTDVLAVELIMSKYATKNK